MSHRGAPRPRVASSNNRAHKQFSAGLVPEPAIASVLPQPNFRASMRSTTDESQLHQGSQMITGSAHTGGDRAGSVFRLYMGGSAIVTWYLAMTEPRSMVSQAASTQAGSTLVWCLLLVGLAAVVDAVVNDFLPDRFHWKTAVRQRHFILCTMAFCYVAQVFVAFSSLRSNGLLAYYLWNAVSIMFINFVDAHQRSRDATCVITCS